MPLEDLLMPPGITYIQAQRRLTAPTRFQPALLGDGAVSASSQHATITATASGTAHTKGAWVEVIAATTNESTLLVPKATLNTFTALSSTNTSTLMDIGVGAGGSEVTVVSNLVVGYACATSWAIPLTILAGSRVAIRCQSAVLSKTVSLRFAFYQMPHGVRPSSSLVTMGDNTATSAGVSIAGTATNTKSSWVEISSATAEPFGALIVGAQADADTSLTTGRGLLDIGAGSAGNEVVIIPDIALGFDSSEYLIVDAGPYAVSIPAGTRLSARWARDNAGNSLDVVLYGVRR